MPLLACLVTVIVLTLLILLKNHTKIQPKCNLIEHVGHFVLHCGFAYNQPKTAFKLL